MIDRSEAEEHLRVIRSLMEKATIYRAISAEAAAVAGALALFAGFGLRGFPGGGYGFTLKWIAVLGICTAANFFFLARDARRRGDAFVSAGMRLALLTMSPALLCGAVFTVMFPQAPTTFWLMCYGLALTSTSAFAPRSIVLLGWSFVLTSLVVFAVFRGPGTVVPWPSADLVMGNTFGLFHLLYAACTWPRRAR